MSDRSIIDMLGKAPPTSTAPLPRTKRILKDRFRGVEEIEDFVISGELSRESGYFRLDSDLICYGQCSSGAPAKLVTDRLHDVREHMATRGSIAQLPFDPIQVLDNLLCERYLTSANGGRVSLPGNGVTRRLYYFVRPFMPIYLRRHVQTLYLRRRLNTPFPHWPVDRSVENICERVLVHWMKSRRIDKVPFIWFWPNGSPSCTILTHDVETSAGMNFSTQLMDLNDSFGMKSSFQLVPEGRYRIPESLMNKMRARGFEVNIHDLNHDGHLMRNWNQFLRRAEKINHYARQYGAVGFRSAILYRNADWYDALNFSFDMSIPNVAHMDPQRGGCCTVLPFFIGEILELPVTTTQDYTLFHILNDYSIQLWKQQIDLIRDKHGLITFIIHPDYIMDQAARNVYSDLLRYLAELRSRGETWITLPGEAAAWWRQRSEMKLISEDGSWRIVGDGSERASLAYARIVDDKLSFELAADQTRLAGVNLNSLPGRGARAR